MAWREMSRRSAFRLAVLYSALFTASALAVMGIVYWQTAGALEREVDATVDAEIEVLAERYRVGGLEGVTELIQERVDRTPSGDMVYLLIDVNGRRLTGNLATWPEPVPVERGYVQFRLGNAPDPLATLRPARGRVFFLTGGYRLLVGRDMLQIRVFQERLLSALGWAVAITSLLALAGAMWVGRTAQARIARINAAIDEIVGGDLARRLPTRTEGDEMDELTDRVNGMLDRIQELMAGVRQVSDNIAHDLRTPLARLKRRLEAAQASGQSREALQGSLEEALAEADGLLATFGALLRIARIEAAGRREGFAEVDVATLVRDVTELYEPLAEAAAVRLVSRVEPGLGLRGDRDLLFQALANLVDNAVKHAPSGSEVTIGAEAGVDVVSLGVGDRGPGIPEADRERVFGRLVRLDDARSSRGSGLGLSLVAAVARLHDGAARMEDNAPGTHAILELPAEPGVASAAAS